MEDEGQGSGRADRQSHQAGPTFVDHLNLDVGRIHVSFSTFVMLDNVRTV